MQKDKLVISKQERVKLCKRSNKEADIMCRDSMFVDRTKTIPNIIIAFEM